MHYHLIGICGTAMAALAGMLQACGHRVTGSTRMFTRRCSTMLAALGIDVMQVINQSISSRRLTA